MKSMQYSIMVEKDNYCLSLNEFEVNTDIYWQKFQNGKDFCDVTLVCKDKNIKTHKFIIFSCLPVLKIF